MAEKNPYSPLVVPGDWKGTMRNFGTQLSQIITDLYHRISKRASRVSDATDGNFAALDRKGDLVDSGHKHSDYLTEHQDISHKADLDQSGKVPSSQLPSYVDDVLEYASLSAFPLTGETGKIYVALDTNKDYRWSGSTYIELSKYNEATQSASGLMSAADKTKLDGVETQANKTTVEDILTSTSTTNALSAAMGKELNTNINTLYTAYPSLRSIDNTRSIVANSDLDDFNTPGVWVCQSATIAATLLNKPDAMNGNFKLIVNINTGNETGSGANWWGTQIILGGVFLFIRNHNENGFGEWFALNTAMQYDDIMSYITWESVFPALTNSSYFKRSGRYVEMSIVSSGNVTLSNGTKIGTITKSTFRPWRAIATSVFDYDSALPLSGSMWINQSGEIRYYGDTITSKKIICQFTYID